MKGVDSMPHFGMGEKRFEIGKIVLRAIFGKRRNSFTNQISNTSSSDDGVI